MQALVTIKSIIKGDRADARICKWILSGNIDDKEFLEKGFIITEIGNWLVDHYPPYVEEKQSKISKSYLLHRHRKQIEHMVELLVKLGLLERAGTRVALKTKEKIPAYKITSNGMFLIYLIRALSTSEKGRSMSYVERCLELIKNQIMQSPSPVSLYFVAFLRQIVEDDLKMSILKTMFYFLKSGLVVLDESFSLLDFFSQIQYATGFMQPASLQEKAKIGFSSLTTPIQESILYCVKLDFERRISEALPGLEWEQLRYEHRNELVVVTIAICEKCHLQTFIGRQAAYYLFEYRKFEKKDYLEACPKCKERALRIYAVWNHDLTTRYTRHLQHNTPHIIGGLQELIGEFESERSTP